MIMADDSTSILRAIEKSSERTEAALGDLSRSIADRFSSLHVQRNGNGALYGIITSFVVVIISLGSIFGTMISGLADRSDIQATFQKERAEMQASFQEERLQTFTRYVDSILAELDVKLQQEIGAEAALRDRRFSQAETDSANRHEAQQAQINEIKAWFKPPALRNNHTEQ